jgi:hypothetical protein
VLLLDEGSSLRASVSPPARSSNRVVATLPPRTRRVLLRTSSSCVRGPTGVALHAGLWKGQEPAKAQQGQMGDRAKDRFLWPDPSRNERKLAEIAGDGPGLPRAKSL